MARYQDGLRDADGIMAREQDDLRDADGDVIMLEEDGTSPLATAMQLVRRVDALVREFGGVHGRHNPDVRWAELQPFFTDESNLHLVLAFLQQQQVFKRQEKHSLVSIGFHYTDSDNLPGVQKTGLLSQPERNRQFTYAAKNNGSAFGDGVYTADESFRWALIGDCGFLVARLFGNTSYDRDFYKNHCDENTDSFANSRVVVLKKGVQTLPLIKFNRKKFVADDKGNARGNKILITLLCAQLQSLVDQVLNDGASPDPLMDDDM